MKMDDNSPTPYKFLIITKYGRLVKDLQNSGCQRLRNMPYKLKVKMPPSGEEDTVRSEELEVISYEDCKVKRNQIRMHKEGRDPGKPGPSLLGE